MANFVNGKTVPGICDRCGERWLLSELSWEVVNQQRTGMRVCPDCFDIDHPQYLLGKTPIYDPQTVKDPRPDTGLPDSRALFGWNPVGNVLTNTLTVSVGTVSVITDNE